MAQEVKDFVGFVAKLVSLALELRTNVRESSDGSHIDLIVDIDAFLEDLKELVTTEPETVDSIGTKRCRFS